MKILLRLISRSFAWMLKGYPRGFRDEFEDEMQRVFEDLAGETSEKGAFALLGTWLRELLWLPASIVREFWYEARGREVSMAGGIGTAEIRVPGKWRDAFLAASPHLLIAILILISTQFNNEAVPRIGRVLALSLLGGGFLAALFYTLRRKWPAWRASWYAYAALIVLLLAVLPSQGWNPPISSILKAGGSLILLLLTLITLRYWLTRRDPVEALLMGIPVVILYWFPITEFISNSLRIWLIFSLFLISALAAMLILRTNDIHKGIWILLGASLLGGLPLALARTYRSVYPSGIEVTPEAGEWMNLFSVQFLAGLALALGPIFGWALWRLGKRFEREGRAAAIVLIGSMIINLFGQYSYWRWTVRMAYFDALGLQFLLSPDRNWSTFIVYAGLIGILVGGIWLAALNWRMQRRVSFSLVLTALSLPLFAMLPPYFGFRITLPGFDLGLYNLGGIQKVVLLSIGIVLMLLGTWTIARLYDRPPEVEAAA